MGAPSIEIPQEERLKIISFKGVTLPNNYQGVVIRRWLDSLYKFNKYFKLIDKDAYYKNYETYIKAVLRRPECVIRFAALESDLDVVFGWCVYEGNILHYIHIQEPYRRKRISYDLIPKDIKWITHLTRHWEEYFMKNPKSKYKQVRFNPFIY